MVSLPAPTAVWSSEQGQATWFRLHRRSFQTIDNRRRPIEGRYELLGDGTFGYTIDDYDDNYPLVIDPVLLHSSSTGIKKIPEALDVDPEGNVYVATTVPVPAVLPDIDFRYAADDCEYPAVVFDVYDLNVVVEKINPANGSIVYATYFGGCQQDEVTDIAVDESGAAYVVGDTRSERFPVSATAFQPELEGTTSAFLGALNRFGHLRYATFLGKSSINTGPRVALDEDRALYIAGTATSGGFLESRPSYQDYVGGKAAFLVKLDLGSSRIIFWTYLDGAGDETVWGLDVTPGTRQAALLATTNGEDLPGNETADFTELGQTDMYLARFNDSGNDLLHGTYIGGTSNEWWGEVAVDAAGVSYVAGTTESTNLPQLIHPQLSGFGGETDGFLTAVNPDGSIAYSVYLGGAARDQANAVDVDPRSGIVFVTGSTQSSDFPLVGAGVAQPSPPDPFLVVMVKGPAIAFSTRFGDAVVVANQSNDVAVRNFAEFPAVHLAVGDTLGADAAGNVLTVGFLQ